MYVVYLTDCLHFCISFIKYSWHRYINPVCQVTQETEFCTVAAKYIWFLIIELASCDPSGVWNFEVGPRVFKKLMYPCFSVYVTIKIFLFCEVCYYWVAVQCVEDLVCVWR